VRRDDKYIQNRSRQHLKIRLLERPRYRWKYAAVIDRDKLSGEGVEWILLKVTIFRDMERCSLSYVTVLEEPATSVSKVKDTH
jgi:hypothetical protein